MDKELKNPFNELDMGLLQEIKSRKIEYIKKKSEELKQEDMIILEYMYDMAFVIAYNTLPDFEGTNVHDANKRHRSTEISSLALTMSILNKKMTLSMLSGLSAMIYRKNFNTI